MKTIAGIALLAMMAWGVTYIPGFVEATPSLLTPPQQTVRVAADDLSPGGRLEDERLVDACHHIPFLARPISNYPATVRVVFTVKGVALGEAVMSCKDGSVLRETRYE